MIATATHIAQARAEKQRIESEVCALTGFTQEQINAIIFERAYEWLEEMGVDADGISQLTHTGQFWSFWKHEWLRGDRFFLDHYNCVKYKGCHEEWYDYFHSHLFTDSDITHAAFHSMIKTLRNG